MKVKVITLYCGENEYKKCIDSVLLQNSSFDVSHVFIENKPNLEAHNLLYKIIMDTSNEYDYFVKLDADMVFKKDDALQTLIDMAIKADADIFSIPVFDFMTNSMIWGVNVYRSGTRWLLGSNSLFTDQQILDGDFIARKVELALDESLVSHAESPSDFQAYIFGIHRSAKVVQKNSSTFLFGHAYGQMLTLRKLYNTYINYKDRKHGLALIGAYMIFKDQTSKTGLFSKDDYKAYFDIVDYHKDINSAKRFFSKSNFRILLSVIGFKRILKGLFYYLKKFKR